MPKRKQCKKCGFPLILGGGVESLEGFKNVRIYACHFCYEFIFLSQNGKEIRRVSMGNTITKENG